MLTCYRLDRLSSLSFEEVSMSFLKSLTNNYTAQYVINKARGVYCPYLFNKFEANEIAKEYIDGLWLGSMNSGYDIKALKERNIRNIVIAVWDIAAPYPDELDERGEKYFRYLKVPLIDREDQPIRDYFNIVVDFIDEAMRRKEGVLVHCVFGKSRSSTLVCAYLMKKHPQLGIKGALDMVKKSRPIVEPNIGFMHQLLGQKNQSCLSIPWSRN